MSSPSLFDLLGLPKEMQHHIIWHSLPQEMRLELTPLVAPGQDPWTTVVSCANAADFAAINGLLSASREVRAMAQEVLARAKEQKLIMLIECTNRDSWMSIAAQSWATLPPAFSAQLRRREQLAQRHMVGPYHLRLVLPVQILPRMPRSAYLSKPYGDEDLVGVLTINISRSTSHGRIGKTTHPWRVESHSFNTLKLPLQKLPFGGLSQLKRGVDSLVKVIAMFVKLHFSKKDVLSVNDLISLRDRFWGLDELPGWDSQHGPDDIAGLEWRKAPWWQAMDSYEYLMEHGVIYMTTVEMPEAKKDRLARESRARGFGLQSQAPKRRGSTGDLKLIV